MIYTVIYNLVRTQYTFWNSRHQVLSKPTDWKAKQS